MPDFNCLSYWHPLLCAASIPAPRTGIVRTDIKLLSLLDGQEPDGWGAFLAELQAACARMGYPAFLRTGQGSGKHDWSRTCFLQRPEDLSAHVAALVEWSECVDFLGLPTNVWAAREFLALDIAFVLPGYRGMPVAKEFRCFVLGGEVQCTHPYWPEGAVEDGRPEAPGWRGRLAALSTLDVIGLAEVTGLAQRASRAVPGAWSVDICRTADGRWLVTDMAEAKRSFHWPDCPNAKRPAHA